MIAVILIMPILMTIFLYGSFLASPVSVTLLVIIVCNSVTERRARKRRAPGVVVVIPPHQLCYLCNCPLLFGFLFGLLLCLLLYCVLLLTITQAYATGVINTRLLPNKDPTFAVRRPTRTTILFLYTNI